MATALSFPTISGVTTPPYLSALTETANIQNTINFLYYGSADSGTTPRTSLSTSSGIYGMLAQLQTQISAVQSGVNVHESAKWATATTLAAVYANGTADASNGTGIGATITFSATGVQKIDSTTTDIAINDRVLVKNGTTALSGTSSTANGIYYVSTAPAIGVAGILTRALDSDNSIAGEMAEGDFLYVAAGDTNANEGFILTSSSTTGTGPAGSIRIGTDGVTYTQFIGVGSYFLGTTAAQISSANQVVTGILSLAMPGSTSGTITLTPAATAGTTAITIPAVAGTLAINPTTTIGDVIYASATGTPGTLTRLAGNITVQPSFLSSTGNASANTTTAFTSSTGSGNVVLVTSPTFATSILGGASMDVFHTGTTTLNFGGAVTSLSIGNTATAAQTVNMFTAATAGGTYNIATAAASSGTKAINIGTAGGAGSTTTINIGTTTGTTPTITLNGTVNTASGSFKVGNTTLAQGGTVSITLPTLAGTLIGSGDTGTVTSTMIADGTIATGDLASSSSTTTGVTYAKMQYASAQYRVLGRITAAAGVIEELTPDNIVTVLGQATTKTGSGNVVLATSPTFATSVIGSASMDVFNTTSTTVNAFGAATTLAIGNSSSGNKTLTLQASANTGTNTINIGTGSVSTGSIAINIGTATISSGAVTTTIGSSSATTTINGTLTLGTTGLVGPATMAAFNTASTNLSIGGAATTMTLGSTSAGTSTVQAGTTLNLNAPAVNGNASTLTLFGTPTTVTAFGAATALTIGNVSSGNKTLTLQSGSSSGTSTINIGTGSVSSGSIVLNLGTATISSGSVTVNIGSSTSTTTIAGTVINSGDGVILKTASFTVGAGERNYNVTGTASVTVTLPTATAGRTINIVNKATFTIVSASSNVMPRTGTQTLGTAICAAVVGSFATLVADGTNWYIMAGA